MRTATNDTFTSLQPYANVIMASNSVLLLSINTLTKYLKLFECLEYNSVLIKNRYQIVFRLGIFAAQWNRTLLQFEIQSRPFQTSQSTVATKKKSYLLTSSS